MSTRAYVLDKEKPLLIELPDGTKLDLAWDGESDGLLVSNFVGNHMSFKPVDTDSVLLKLLP